jgi:hypothetical protein
MKGVFRNITSLMNVYMFLFKSQLEMEALQLHRHSSLIK